LLKHVINDPTHANPLVLPVSAENHQSGYLILRPFVM